MQSTRSRVKYVKLESAGPYLITVMTQRTLGGLKYDFCGSVVAPPILGPWWSSGVRPQLVGPPMTRPTSHGWMDAPSCALLKTMQDTHIPKRTRETSKFSPPTCVCPTQGSVQQFWMRGGNLGRPEPGQLCSYLSPLLIITIRKCSNTLVYGEKHLEDDLKGT